MAVHLLITGYARSGMTLVNRLLDAHPQVSIADRTMLPVLAQAMQSCLTARGLPEEGYPFRPLFDETGYGLDDVTAFFRVARWEQVAETRVERATGEMSSAVALADLLRRASAARAAAVGKSGALVHGLREHFCEVLAPYLLECGVRVLLVLRDPTDLIASARLGNHGWELNRRVSVLQIVRQWRKSVALAVVTAGHPAARVVRYEHLATRPTTWRDLCQWLGIDAIPAESLLSSSSTGEPWAGNSSFGPLQGLSAQPIGRGALLPASVAAFVRAATAPERRLLGDERERPDLVPYTSEAEIDPAHAPEAETALAESAREGTRRSALCEDQLDPADARRWFIHPDVHRRLHDAWSAAVAEGTTSRM